MSSLPTRTDISGTPSNATAKAALSALFDFVAQRFASGTSGAGTATAAELASARDSMGVPQINWLHNPDGAVYQRTPGATLDDNYMDDRWYALTQTSSITPSQVSHPEDGHRFALRLTQSQVTAQRMGRAQIVEGKDAVQLRGKAVTFGGRVKLSTAANLRMAILAWTGAEDVVTSDVVNDWTNGTYTTGNFFASTTLTLVATSSTALSAATAANASVGGTIPSTANNIIVLYWTEATAAQNVTLDAWGLRLVEAGSLIDYIRRSHAQEVGICARYLPAMAWAASSNFIATGQAFGATTALTPIPFTTETRVPVTGMTATGSFIMLSAGGGALAVTSITLRSSNKTNACVDTSVASSLSAGDASALYSGSAGSIIFTGAEL